MEWSPSFLALRPSAAKVFAIAWQKKIADMLRQGGLDPTDASPVRAEAFKMTMAESSSLPVRDKVYLLVTLHCAVALLALYHPHGEGIDTTERPRGWSDKIWGRYLSLLHRHGMYMKITPPA